MTRSAATSAALAVAALAALATASVADASTVTANKNGSVVFRAQSGVRANVLVRANAKSHGGRSVLSIKVTDAAAQTLVPKGRCKQGSNPRVAICTALSSKRLRSFRVQLSDGNDRLRWADFTTIRNTRFQASGGAGDDVLTLPRAGDRLYGNAGDDKLTGGGGGDRLVGGAGNDALSGGAGRDYLIGGAGDDALVGGGGIDRLVGLLGNDLIDSADGVKDRLIRCGDGHDSLLRDAIDVADAQFCENIATP
ncbi:MAG: Alkaline phosphatase [uncultured Solirubrobacteraceae bacterium]|uniref:Alkaline phosphatase n=1 Tax=uncultured Solirubrobacteraceae bacterium TaxID=1162706 RepID=A0A6J4SCE8_9ACTN|nr:MAG: Alkaline phosphatase [uncultured Solirubrobacteraceae bacterium]